MENNKFLEEISKKLESFIKLSHDQFESKKSREDFEKEISVKIQNKFDKNDKNSTLRTAIFGALVTFGVVGCLAFMLNQFSDYQKRLSRLETKFDLCVKCGENDIKYGGYLWQRVYGYEMDENNNVKLGIEIDILSEEFRWKCASVEEIVRFEEPVDFDKIIQGFSDKKHLKGVEEIICIGTASQEGQAKGEEFRAEQRMETLINKFEDNLSSDLPILGLNVGQHIKNNQYSNECSNATLKQRRVMVIKVLERDERLTEIQYRNSLVKILLEKSKSERSFPFNISNYSKFTNKTLKLTEGRR